MFLWQLLDWIVHLSLDHCAPIALTLVTSGQLCTQRQLLTVSNLVTITLQDCQEVSFLLLSVRPTSLIG